MNKENTKFLSIIKELSQDKKLDYTPFLATDGISTMYSLNIKLIDFEFSYKILLSQNRDKINFKQLLKLDGLIPVTEKGSVRSLGIPDKNKLFYEINTLMISKINKTENRDDFELLCKLNENKKNLYKDDIKIQGISEFVNNYQILNSIMKEL